MFHVKHILPRTFFCANIILCNKYIVNWSELESSSHINLYLCALFFLEEFIMPDKYFNILMKLAKKAYQKDEVPISALIVYKDKVIAKAYNYRQNDPNVLNHAEIRAIIKASKKLKDWRLNNCDLYVTLKPCSMCEAIIKQARISNVYYLIDKLENKKEYNNVNIVKTNIRMQEDKYKELLQSFFSEKRK